MIIICPKCKNRQLLQTKEADDIMSQALKNIEPKIECEKCECSTSWLKWGLE